MLVTKGNGVAGGRAADAGDRGGVPAAEPVAGGMRGHLRPGAGGEGISRYFGFMVGWITILAYVGGVVSISLPSGPYVVSLFGNSSSRPGEAVVGVIAVVLGTVIAYLGVKVEE